MRSVRFGRRAGVGVGLACLSALLLLAYDPHDNLGAQAVDPCAASPVNQVACENSKPGNPASEWDISGAGSALIQGFATSISVNRGETIGFKVSTSAASHRLDIYRLGYYGGLGARKVAQIDVLAPALQPACASDATTGLVDCGVWAQTAAWSVPADAVSGIYVAKLVRTDGGSGASHIVFVVRDDTGQSDILFQTSDTTWQAYNRYGGNSLYVGSPAGRAYKVSYNRPFTTRGDAPEDWLFNAEYPMLRWLEANGYNVSYFTGVDTDRRGAEILEHKVFLSVGHDEYWSGQQRRNVEAARDAGVHLAFFSGNEVFWKTRWESSADGTATPYRTLVSYKETHANAKIDPEPGVWTGTWRDPRFSPPDDGGLPENALTGTLFTVNCCSYAITVPEPFGKMRFWRNTSVAALNGGQSATLAANTLGYEWDEDPDNGFRPRGLIRLSSTTANVQQRLLDYGSTYGPGTATHSLTLYRAPSGALVFGAGTVQWSWGLDATHDRTASTVDPRMQQATVNLLADMAAQPSTLQPGLVAATASSDLAAPSSAIAAPANGASVATGAPLVVSGTATDIGGLVAAVEVSVDGGATWKAATGRGSWTFNWTPTAPGSVNIKSRAIDDSGHVENAGAGNTVTVLPSTSSTGLVAAYAFEEGAGPTISDISGRGNTGTLTNATWTETGRYGRALSFNGTNAWVTVADAASLDLTNAMTLEAWVRPATLSGWRTALIKERGTGLSYALYAHDGARPNVYIRLGGGDRTVAGTSAIAANTWTHLATTFDGATLRLYVNGAQVASRPFSGSITASADPLRIGGNAPWGEYFSGLIDEVRVYSRVLTAAEIQADMNTPVGTADVTPPAVSSVVPAPGATNVQPTSVVTAVFSEPIDPASLTTTTFELRDAGGQIVPATVSYDTNTLTARLTPAAPLALNATHAALIRGGGVAPRIVDLAGNALSQSMTWTFTTAAQVQACPCSIWPAGTTPQTLNTADADSVEVGVKFQSDRAGYITGIRFYKGSLNTGTHVGSLWTSSGTLLSSAAFTSESASGWQQATFSPAVQIAANTIYVASYFAPVGRYSSNTNFFGSAVDAPPLRAVANSTSANGVYRYGATSTFPNLSSNATNYWVDVVFVDTVPADTTAPTVVSRSPDSGATGASLFAPVTVTFDEGLDASTVTSSTFELRLAATVVPATVTYNAVTRTAALQPASMLAPATVYTATIRGGATDPRIKDVAGNALAATSTWSFTTASAPPPPPDEGPGGPVLIVASSANPYTRYLGEILRTEGLNLFTLTDISRVTAAMLGGFDVVVLGETTLTAAQVSMFADWVAGGGNLIAMRPDKQLATLLGLTDATGTIANQYLQIAQSGPGAGLVAQTIQFHGTADRYTLNGATAVATLFSSAATATTNPAVSLRSVGANGGQAAAFTYDLARSVAWTRQGNPAWSGQNRDGDGLVRSDDLFYGAAGGDPQPDWIDLTRVAIPQADEQQRLLANLILTMNADRRPLPRLWYLPRGLKAAVVMTGDDHASGATAGRFDAFKSNSTPGCSVANWECLRMTSYIYPNTPLTNAKAAGYVADGFEIAAHITTGCEGYTASSLESDFAQDLASFAAKYTSVPAPVTNRTHCIAWSDYATQPRVSLAHGIRFDTNYYFYPASWVQNRPGLFSGSGMPMRFTDVDGTIIDVYQAVTQMTDESGQTYPFTIDALLDRALGAEGYYGVFTANMHTDTVAHAGSDAIVASAQARNVPVVSSQQMLKWLDGRNASSFSGIGWTGNVLGFTLTVASGANGAQVLLPRQAGASTLQSLTRDGAAVAVTVQTIKGVQYAVFAGTTGAYAAAYAAPVETTITSAPPASTTQTSASFSFASNVASATFQCSLDGSAFTACTSPRAYSALPAGGHTFAVRAIDGSTVDDTPATYSWTIATQPPDTTITGMPAASTTSTTASFTFTANAAGATFECSLDGAAFAACTSPRSYTGLAVGTHTFSVRAVNAAGADPTPATYQWTITTPPPSTANLVAAFGFEEGTGATTADSSGTGNNGTLSNATWTTAGRYGNALSFNGTNAWVTVLDSNSLDLTTAMTLEAWVRPAAVTSWRTVLLKERTGGLAYGLYGSDGARPTAWIRTSGDYHADGTALVPTAAWTHLAATYDGATLRLYVNGAQVGTRTISGTLTTSTSALRIGGNVVWGEYFNGLIDEVRVYSRVLTAAEIQSDMNTPIRP